MQIPSKLGSATLGDILGALYRERVTGTLELIESRGAAAGSVHRIHIQGGLIAGVETPSRTRRLGDILRVEGLVEPTTQTLLDRVPLFSRGRLYGKCLLDARLLTPQALDHALDCQQKDRLEALFRVGDASLRFRVARPKPGAGTTPLGPQVFLYGRPRARGRGAAGTEIRRDAVRARALRTLGLGHDATEQDVREAFRRLARAEHPDRHPGAAPEERAHRARRFSALSSAYHRLIA